MCRVFVEITAVTTLTNATNVHYYLWDGTNKVPLSKVTGATLSGAQVGSIILKNKVATDELTIVKSDQCRLTEVLDSAKGLHWPYMITAKNGVNNYIYFSLTTTDTPINFKAKACIEYCPIDGGTLEFA